MKELCTDSGSMPVDRLGHFSHTGDRPILIQSNHVVSPGAPIIDGASSNQNKPGPSSCPLLVKVDESIIDQSFRGVSQVHCGHDDPVL